MRAARALAIAATITAAGCAAGPPAAATKTSGKAGHGSLSARLSYYANGDDRSDGNPFLDEALTVLEVVAILDYNVTDDWSISAEYAYDLVTSASIDRLDKFPQQTGASGDDYRGVDLGTTVSLDGGWTTGGTLSFSQEYDYDSFGVGWNLGRELEDGNTTLGLSLNAFWDRLDIIRFDGDNQEGKTTRRSLSATGTWYQILDRETHASVGLTLTWQQGFLEAAYNAYVVEDPAMAPNPNLDNLARGLEQFEALPGNRYRAALFGQIRRWLPTETAVELGSRVYADTWGLEAVTLEPLVRQWVVKDVLSLGLRYRWHRQSGVAHFHRHFTGPRRYGTQDADLAPLTTNGVGLLWSWKMLESVTLDGLAEWTTRNDGIDFWSVGTGVVWEF